MIKNTTFQIFKKIRIGTFLLCLWAVFLIGLALPPKSCAQYNHVTEPSEVNKPWQLDFRPNPLFNSVKYPEADLYGLLNALSLGVGYRLEIQTIPVLFLSTRDDLTFSSIGFKYQYYQKAPWTASIGYLKMSIQSNTFKYSNNAINFSTRYEFNDQWSAVGNLIHNWAEISFSDDDRNGINKRQHLNFNFPMDKYLDFSRKLSDQWALTLGLSETNYSTELAPDDSRRRYGVGGSIHHNFNRTFSKKYFLNKASIGQHIFDRDPWNVTLFSVSLNGL